MFRRAVRSGRVQFGVLASAASSGAGFLLTVAQAHSVSLGDFGAFAVASAVLGLVIGTVRSAIAQPALALAIGRSEIAVATARTSLAGVIIAAAVLACAIVLNLPYLMITAIALPGVALYDTIRTFRLSIINPRQAFFQDVVWAGFTIVGSILALTGQISGLAAYAVWAVSGALIGYAVVIICHCPLAPRWASSSVPTSTSFAFGADFLVGGGGTLVTMNLLAAFAGSTVVGAIRGAGTLLGPVGLMIGVLPTLLIPSLRAFHDTSARPLRTSLRLTGLIGLSGLPAVLFIAMFPGTWGSFILGDVWPVAQPVLPFLAVDTFCTLIATVPLSGHRTLLAGRASLRLRLVLAIGRTAFVVWAGVQAGAGGAGVAIAITAILSTTSWWISYMMQLRRRQIASTSSDDVEARPEEHSP